MSSNLDSDLECWDPNPTLYDKIDSLEHYVLDLTRKLSTFEDKIIQTQTEIYRLEIQNRIQKKFNNLLSVMFTYLFCLTLPIVIIMLTNV